MGPMGQWDQGNKAQGQGMHSALTNTDHTMVPIEIIEPNAFQVVWGMRLVQAECVHIIFSSSFSGLYSSLDLTESFGLGLESESVVGFGLKSETESLNRFWFRFNRIHQSNVRTPNL